jgi:hypothetical protein
MLELELQEKGLTKINLIIFSVGFDQAKSPGSLGHFVFTSFSAPNQESDHQKRNVTNYQQMQRPHP